MSFRVLGDAGNTRTAVTVAAEFERVRPDVILLSGLAGSLDHAAARLGDVFVSDMAKTIFPDKIKEIDPAKEVVCALGTVPPSGRTDAGLAAIDPRKLVMGDGDIFRYRRDIAQSPGEGLWTAHYVNGLSMRPQLALEGVTEDLLEGLPPPERARHVNLLPTIRSGAVFASEMVVDSQGYIDFLQERNRDESIGWYATRGGGEGAERNPWVAGEMPIVDMESYGFFKFVETMSKSGTALRGFAIRGISDLAAGKSNLDGGSRNRIREIAGRNAAVVTLDLLRALDAGELSGRP